MIDRHDTPITQPPQIENPKVAGTRRRLEKLAHVLDTAIPLPGGIRIGLDGFLGLVPGVGDLSGTLLSSYIIAEAHRLDASPALLLRMALNVIIDSAVGMVPIFGDLFDFAWRSNRRNMLLLNEHLERPVQTRKRSRWILVAVIVGMVAAVALTVFAAMAVIRAIIAIF